MRGTVILLLCRSIIWRIISGVYISRRVYKYQYIYWPIHTGNQRYVKDATNGHRAPKYTFESPIH